jgi:uncharacterized membrane protein (UPF0127 family)
MRKKVMVLNISRDEIILEEAEIADTFFRRLKGLLGRKSLPPGTGLVIKPCRAIHTAGMSFSIDVAFVDRESRICLLLDELAPWRLSPTVRQASYVIEAPAGTFRQKQTKNGDSVKLKEI